MKKKNKGNLFIFLTLIMIIFVASGLFVSLMLKSKEQNISHKNGLEVTFQSSSQNVELKNILPMSDELGKKLNEQSVENYGYGYLSFTIKNRNEKKTDYNIYIVKSEIEGNKINDKFIKFYLTDKNNNPVGDYSNNRIPTYPDLLSLSSLPAGRLILSDTLEANQEKEFILRSWVSDFYNMVSEEEMFNYDVFIKAK